MEGERGDEGKRVKTTATREAASSMGLRTTASCHCHKKRREVEYQFFSSPVLQFLSLSVLEFFLKEFIPLISVGLLFELLFSIFSIRNAILKIDIKFHTCGHSI